MRLKITVFPCKISTYRSITENNMDTKQFLCGTTKKFWEYYLLASCSEQLVIIGTASMSFMSLLTGSCGTSPPISTKRKP